MPQISFGGFGWAYCCDFSLVWDMPISGGRLRSDWTGGELSACDPLGLGAFIRVLHAWPLVGMKHRVGQAQRSVWHKTRGSESDPFSLFLPFPSCW